MTSIHAAQETVSPLRATVPKRSFPKTAFLGEVLAGRHLAEFVIEFTGNAPGEIEKVAAILTQHKVNVLTGFHNYSIWSFFADFTESDVSPAQMEQQLTRLSQVSYILFKESSDGVLVDTLNFPFVWNKHRALLFRAETLNSIISRIWEMFGANGSVPRVMLYAMGQAAGRSTARTIIEDFGAATVTKHVPAALDIYSSLGWAQASGLKSDFDGARAEIQVVDNFECLPHKGQDQKPYSNFLRGHLAGLFSELMGKRVDAEETNCIAQGDPCCLFKIAPAGQGDSK